MPKTAVSISSLRPIWKIAGDIQGEWIKVNPAAQPYLDAMFLLNDRTTKYGLEDGEMIVSYFLSNSSTFRGEIARLLKKELQLHLKAV